MAKGNDTPGKSGGKTIVGTGLVFLLGFVLAAVLIVSGALETVLANIGLSDDAPEAFAVSTTALQERIESASDLITTRYFYTDAEVYEDYKTVLGRKVPFTTDRQVFTYSGQVSLGIDVSQIKFAVDEETKTVTIYLPGIQVVANEIDGDSFMVELNEDSVLNDSNVKDFGELTDELKQKQAERVLGNDEFMAEAQANSVRAITELFESSTLVEGYAVVVTFDEPSEGAAVAPADEGQGA
jgi:hypothetical protein